MKVPLSLALFTPTEQIVGRNDPVHSALCLKNRNVPFEGEVLRMTYIKYSAPCQKFRKKDNCPCQKLELEFLAAAEYFLEFWRGRYILWMAFSALPPNVLTFENKKD
jgi:hypothetical protein